MRVSSFFSKDMLAAFFRQLPGWLTVSVVSGLVVSLFMVLLREATKFRFAHPWLVYALPLAGLGIHFLYKSVGKSSERGNNLIIDEIHEPAAGVPPQMGPLILATTVITHLFGGSAGREGTAVQIGGSIAAIFKQLFRFNAQEGQTLLTCGIAAGFGAVFGTPVTGAVFAIEVLTVGKLRYKDLLPCLLSAFVGDGVVAALGIHHMHVLISAAGLSRVLLGYFRFDALVLIKAAIAAIFFGLISFGFAWLTHRLKDLFLEVISVTWIIPLAGGLMIIGLFLVNGRPDYLGLGVDPQYPGAVTIPSSFNAGGAEPFCWFWKILYTTVTLSTGFKGGEVTPLFYIGATSGNALAGLLNAPVSLFAALGFIAVFAGAAKTPVACTLMGMELFGAEYAVFFAAAAFIAFWCSGKQGIYPAQRRSTGR